MKNNEFIFLSLFSVLQMWIPCHFGWSSKPRPKAEIDDIPLFAYSIQDAQNPSSKKSQIGEALRP